MQKTFSNLKEKIALQGLDKIPVGILWIAKNGSLLSANDKFCEERGYTIDEIEQLHIRDINPLISTKGWKRYWETVKEKKFRIVNSEHMTKDGKVFPVEIKSNYIQIDGFEVVFTIIFSLLERDKFRYLLELTSNYSKIVGWEWDTMSDTYSHTTYLDTLCEASGIEGDGNFLRMLKELLPKPSFAAFKSELEKIKKSHKGFELDYHVKEKPGIDSWFKITGEPLIIDDELLKVYGTIQDVSNHRNFSDKMYLLKHYMDNSSDQVFWTDDSGKFDYANLEACKSLGYSAHELYKLYVWDVVKITKEEWFAHWEKLKQIGFFEMENIQVDKSGKTTPVKTKKYALEYEGKYYNVGIVRDISKEKQREAKLEASLEKISELQTKLSSENSYLKEEILKEYRFSNIISKSDNYKKVLILVKEVAETDATVLILGESGTGKELLASAVHELSKRSDDAFIKINCAALPENLIESELFGHEKGAFTGAFAQKIGRFELADGGTIFLDEIGELPLELQSKMLRVIQEGEFQRLGSTNTIKVDVRIIAATNRDLVKEVKRGRFREDLFFRLNVFPITNIPLRKRRDDIPLLAQFFLNKFADKMHKPIEGISPKSIKRLVRYDYPGNVRELENIIERAVITNKGKVLTLPASLFVNKFADDEQLKGWLTFDELQRDYIIKVLEHTNWKVTGKGGAAEILNMNGKTLYSKMTKFGITKN